MTVPNTALNSKSNRLFYPAGRYPVFGVDSRCSLQLASRFTDHVKENLDAQ
jgi:hypothetical protein